MSGPNSASGNYIAFLYLSFLIRRLGTIIVIPREIAMRIKRISGCKCLGQCLTQCVAYMLLMLLLDC